MKRQPSEWEKIIANKTTDKVLISKIYEQLIKLNITKTNSLIKKMGRKPKQTFLQRKHIVVQSLSHVQLFVSPWTAASQASLSFAISQSLLKLMSIELVVPSNHLILSSPSPPAFNLSQHWVFSNELALHIRWTKHWSLSFSISPSSEYSGLISFRIDWFDLLAVQGTLKNLLQHHSSKASILQCSAFFIVQLSHSYVTT